MYQKILDAAGGLAGIAHRTPVLTSRTLDETAGTFIFMKCENFQRAGAFKFRGAYNALRLLSPDQAKKGVVTYSSGNHAQALALAGSLLHIPVTVVMPQDAPKIKLAATRGYGAQVRLYDRRKEDRKVLAEALASEKGYTVIPPFDHLDVIAGQGTLAKEFLDEVFSLDYLFVPCGGGGLLSGCAAYVKNVAPQCRVIGVEPATADDGARSFKSGVIQSLAVPTDTIADGLRTDKLGELTFPLIQQYVDDMVTVSEEEILSTMYYIWARLKVVVEPSSAVALAPVFHRKTGISNQRVGIVFSGGNVDVREIGKLFADLSEE